MKNVPSHLVISCKVTVQKTAYIKWISNVVEWSCFVFVARCWIAIKSLQFFWMQLSLNKGFISSCLKCFQKFDKISVFFIIIWYFIGSTMSSKVKVSIFTIVWDFLNIKEYVLFSFDKLKYVIVFASEYGKKSLVKINQMECISC